jgi:hypothetical protein
MTLLTKKQRSILDILRNDEEPFEFVDSVIEEIDPESTPLDTLNELLDLYKMGFVIIKQQPITALNQDFSAKEIHPESARDILGDLFEYFEHYCRERKYIWELDIGDGSAGVPFGIWVELTPSGREEADKREYEEYLKDIDEGE